MSERVEHYTQVTEDVDTESLTVLVVSGATVADVRSVVAADAGLADGEVVQDDERSAYVFVEVDGGVLAMEHSGFAGPTVEALTRLSEGGRSAAVVGSDIQAWDRFGCARDGVLLFDDPEYTFLDADDLSRVPDELRPLLDLARVDLDSDEDDDDSAALAFAVGLAMAELVTGIHLGADDLLRDWDDRTVEELPVRTLAYATELSARRETDGS
ncbi:hypothetical protein F4692_001103 [Nocardioides cavernae]|uniref:Uncharacterized protein n=1 Tax=Nocardioides cavernae TaxID=1921566 RepID=A0A7Y9KQX3_9ACTN|nr:DUF6461 domain-containing protein [Nocardioides cavernae]NYE35999.1 hypothetical protein [Nocardioides cavernae]